MNSSIVVGRFVAMSMSVASLKIIYGGRVLGAGHIGAHCFQLFEQLFDGG